VRRLLVLGLLLVAAVGSRVDTAGARTTECQGFLVCVRVAGPWVIVPVSQRTPRPEVQFQLRCPKGFIVGGVDAELTDRATDIWFLGALGSPIAPGRATSRTIVFVASYVGDGATNVSFRPHAGCIPGGGGGRRTPTSFSALVPPGHPTIRRVRTFRVTKPAFVAVACRRDEHLVAAYSARAFRTQKPPAAALAASLSARPALALDHITVAVRGGRGRGVVQVAAVCAGGK
jgi:hypothetical protein